jgi:2-polyprenyl-6-methoxyphenol hydroxylase-like FAD-dependent oxidoreductase
MTEFDVVVVGGGPVGLALAGDLGWRGVRTLLVERSDGSITQPKMDGINVRTMEFCRRWGITDAIRNCGYPKDYPQDMVYLTSFSSYELGREEFSTPSGGAEDRRTSNSPESRFRCPQNLFDPILREFAFSQATVRLDYRTRLERFLDDGTQITITLIDEQTGAERVVRSRYLVGCDGAASRVRQLLDIPMRGLGTLTYSTNVLFRCEALAGFGHIRPGYRYLFVGPEGTWATVVAISGKDIWRLSIIGGVEPIERDEHAARLAIRRVIGEDLPFEILSVMPWVRREAIAQRWRTGNVFLAGDSAHLTSPTGGFGMNLGIADAVDLSWKLEAMLRGWGGSALLDTYECERKPVAERAVREASGNLLRTLSPGPQPALLQPDREGALLRYRVGQKLSATMLREWYKLGIDLGYVYDTSPIVIPDTEDFDSITARNLQPSTMPPPSGRLIDGTPLSTSMLREWQRLSVHLGLGQAIEARWNGFAWTELPAADVMLYRQSARPGARAPHAWLTHSESTLDWFGRGFVLIHHPEADSASIDALRAAAASRQTPLTSVHTENADVTERYAAPLVIVRPDGHVAWRGRSASAAQALQIVDRIRGAAT